MPLKFETIHLPLRAGLDTKSHAQAIEPPKLLEANNIVFDEIGSLKKRPGTIDLGRTTVAAGTITASRMRGLGVLGDELVLFAEGRCYTWSEKESAWIDRGRFESFLAAQETLCGDGTDQVTPDFAQTGNVMVVAWEDRTNTAVRYRCIDLQTGAPMQSSTAGYVASASRPRCLALNGKLLVFYWVATTTIKCDVIDPADVYGTVGTPVNIATDAAGPFDVDGYNATECAVAYVVDTTLVATVKRVDSAGSVTTTRATARAADVAVAINYNATADRFALVRLDADVAGADTVYLDWIKADLTDDGAATVPITVVTEGSANVINNVGVAVLANQTAYVFWDLMDATIAGVAVNGRQFGSVFRALVSTTAVTSERVLARRCMLGSRPVRWSDGSTERVMIHVYYTSDLMSMYALLDAGFVAGDRNDTNANRGEVGIMARLFPGEGPSTTSTRTVSATVGGLFRNGHLPQIESIGSNQYTCALTYQRGSETTTTNFKRVYHERGIRRVTYTAFDSRAFLAREEGGCLYGPGGYVWKYDGQRVVESNFWLYPDFSSLSGTDGVPVAGMWTGSNAVASGLTSLGTYYYRWYYEWRNARGERERSTYSRTLKITLTDAAHDTITFNLLPTLQFTSKWRGVTSTEGSSVRLVGYRTTSTDSSKFYRFTSFDPNASNAAPINNPNAEFVTFVDSMADTTLTDQEQDYISAAELDHTAPPATPFIAMGQARGFTRHPENQYLLLYSLQRKDGEALAFHGEHQLSVPRDGGPIIYVVATEGALLIFCEDAIYVATGQGPSNTGGPPDYGSPQRVADVGCTDPRSVVRTPSGILFRSKKGIYRIGLTGGGLDYVGAGVEDHNSLSIYGAVSVPDKHRVEFTTSDATLLVYDYLVGEWSVWESTDIWGNGKHAVLWNDTAIRLDASGIWEPQATFADTIGGVSTGYSRTAYMRIRRPGNIMRIRHVWVEGEYKSPHDLRVTLSYEDGAASENKDYSILTAPTVYRYSASPSSGRQTAQAIEIRITDLTPTGGGTWREASVLTGIALNVGFKPGGSKLPSAQLK